MKTKLWEKEKLKIPKFIEEFTIGKDKELDLLLAKYDVIGSIAHAKMLESIGLLTKEESNSILNELKNIQQEIQTGKFKIEDGVEDVHSQIEILLTQRIGEAGKKIHTGRSRNDQVLVCIKFFIREELRKTSVQIKNLFDTLISLSEKHKDYYLPGYTHFQIAMPSSFGLWFAAYAESLVDDMEMIVAAYNVANKNPLGSGAGFGSSFPLNRKMTTELLGFETMNFNSVYAQMTRGKTEKIASMALATVAATLSKFAYDVCLYTNQNFGFISFPDELTTGSSIMPHKKNPDVFELIRAKCNKIQSVPNELTLLTNNLPSGYHRDFQLTKEILFPAMKELQNCIEVTCFMLQHIEVKENILEDEKYNYLFSVEAVNELVKQGISFRDAYKKVGQQIELYVFSTNKKLNHSHEGSIGNLKNEEIIITIKELISRLEK